MNQLDGGRGNLLLRAARLQARGDDLKNQFMSCGIGIDVLIAGREAVVWKVEKKLLAVSC